MAVISLIIGHFYPDFAQQQPPIIAKNREIRSPDREIWPKMAKNRRSPDKIRRVVRSASVMYCTQIKVKITNLRNVHQ